MKKKRRFTRNQQVLALTREFLKSRVSAAGISYVVTSKSKFRRNIWSIILLFTAGVMAYMTYRVISEYLKYPKTVVKEDSIYPWVYFPAVTICALNPISSTNLDKTSVAKYRKLRELLLQSKSLSVRSEARDECYGNPMCRWSWFREQCGCVSSPCSSEFCVDETEKNCSCSLNMCDNEDKTLSGACRIVNVKGKDQCWCEMDFKYSRADIKGNSSENVKEVIQSLKEEDLKEIITLVEEADCPDLNDVEEDLMPTLKDIYNYGTEFDSFVLSCSFEGKRCDKEDFTMFFHPKYGKCYMFNYAGGSSTTDDKTAKIRNYGSSSGLFLMLQTNVDDVVELLRRDMGVRVVIHNAKELPFISEHGFNVRIGDLTAVEVTLSLTKRLGHPWGACMNDSSHLPFAYDYRPYNQLSCQKTCHHHYTMKFCSCTKRSYLMGKIVQGSIGGNLRFCRSSNKIESLCLLSVRQKIERNKINCKCVASCWEKYYSTSLSTSLINKAFFRTVKGVRTLRLQENGTSSFDNAISVDMTGLKVYYKSLQVEILEEVPSYSWETLVANIGGNLGFFMGLSLVTFVEVCEFLWDILLSALSSNRTKVKKSETDDSENENSVHNSKPESNFFSEALHFLRREQSTPQDRRITELLDVSVPNSGTNVHPIDVYTLPRKRTHSRRLYSVRSPTLGRYRSTLFKRRQVLTQRRGTFSSSPPYNE